MASGVDSGRPVAFGLASLAANGRIVHAQADPLPCWVLTPLRFGAGQRAAYLVPVEYGGQRRYRVADVQQILKGGRHDR